MDNLHEEKKLPHLGDNNNDLLFKAVGLTWEWQGAMLLLTAASTI